MSKSSKDDDDGDDGDDDEPKSTTQHDSTAVATDFSAFLLRDEKNLEVL
jgi:hypothetical protein